MQWKQSKYCLSIAQPAVCCLDNRVVCVLHVALCSLQYINTVERADKLGRVLYDVTATVVVWYCILLHGAHVYYSIWNKYNAYACLVSFNKCKHNLVVSSLIY